MFERRFPHRRLRGLLLLGLVAGLAAVGGCTHNVKIEPIKVEPIYITLDIRLKVERELEDFFDFEDRAPVPAPESAGGGEGGST